ncbi:hypothetical protein ANN_15826 [Periplaneta americana]|uniref:PiggyBac transposable element-derived protein domain-containing protein n=1 Tax=Periplaneta americana TaxID=6978 RepID=A0ABQ8SIG8_PERAM|nr:hypothetical protein ANN_15826 [Periplaneta americana]
MMLKLIRKRKRNWLGHWLRRNCLLKDALEGMVNGRRVRGRRRYQMIDNTKIYGSYVETMRKAENKKDWIMQVCSERLAFGQNTYVCHEGAWGPKSTIPFYDDDDDDDDDDAEHNILFDITPPIVNTPTIKVSKKKMETSRDLTRNLKMADIKPKLGTKGSGCQHSLKWVTGKQCITICTIVQKEKRGNIPASGHGCTLVQCLIHRKDTEQLIKWLDEVLDADDPEICASIHAADEIEVVLNPPADGGDSDRDDGGSDDEKLLLWIWAREDINFESKVNEPRVEKRSENLRTVASHRALPSNSTTSSHLNVYPSSNSENVNKSIPKKVNKSVPKKAKYTTEWIERNLHKTNLISLPPSPNDHIFDLNFDKSPDELFKMVFDLEIMGMICRQTVLYAAQKGCIIHLSIEELYTYFAILLVSGYVKVPHRRLFWETRDDSHNLLISNAMTRNRFDIIHRFLHFSDNSEIDQTDRVFKVRPLIDYVNNKFQESAQPLGSKYSLDEAVLWPSLNEAILSRQTSTVRLQVLVFSHTFVFIDNYFNSLELLNTMLQHNVNVTGTIRADRTGNAPLKDLGKQSRGATHTLQSKDKKVMLIKWQDNNQVTMGTNVQDENVTLAYGTCQRWNQVKRNVLLLLNRQSSNTTTRYPLLEFIRRITLVTLSTPKLSSPRTSVLPKKPSLIPTELRYDGKSHLVQFQDTQRHCGLCKKSAKYNCIKCKVALHPKDCFLKFHTK